MGHLEKQLKGEYQSTVDAIESLTYNGNILNYINPSLEIVRSEGKGRGIFSTDNIKKGDILLVEKAVAQVTQYKRGGVYKGGLTELLKQITILAKNDKRIENLRMSYLYDGISKESELKIPDLSIYRDLAYK